MFHTLNGETFKLVHKSKKPVGVQLPTVKTTRFYGARARSNSGCLTCRRRKKKCDEAHPKCGSCKLRAEECEWPVDKKKGPPRAPRKLQIKVDLDLDMQVKQPSEIPPTPSHVASAVVTVEAQALPALPKHSSATPEDAGAAKSPESFGVPPSLHDKMRLDFLDNGPDDFRVNEVVQGLEIFREDLTNFQLALEQLRSGVPGITPPEGYAQAQGTTTEYIPTEFLASFGFPYVYNLDQEGMTFLECYREQYCPFVSIGLESLNYLLKTFLGMAAQNEGILYALTAWGGFYYELQKPRSDFTKPWEYMQKATRCMCAQMGDYLRPNDQGQFFALFTFYLIFIGIEVCTGDVRNWRSFMTQCMLLIQSFGGILGVAERFGHSNDITWLISDFKFHDLLSSGCLIDGPMFPIEHYEQALVPRAEYGIDPFHGIVGPAYDILGYIGRKNAQLRRKWENGDSAAYYAEAGRSIDEISGRIDRCRPLEVHLALLSGNPADRELHVALFDLHIIVCRIQLYMTLGKVPPSAVTQQHLLHTALKLLDTLQDTRLKVSIAFLLLVCGMTCCAAADREGMTRRFRLYSKQYELCSFQRIEETVVEAWARNPAGTLCVDWTELVQEKEWQLYCG